MAEDDTNLEEEHGVPISVLALRSTRAVFNVTGALIIAGLFLIILTTAIAQQSILLSLNDGEPKLTYSTAHAMIRDVEQRQGQLFALALEARLLRVEHAQAERRFEAISTEYEEAWQQFQPLVRRVMTDCAIEPAGDLAEREPRSALWSDTIQCQAEDRMPMPLRRRLEPIFGQQRNFLQVAQEYGARQSALNQLATRLRDAQSALIAAREVTAEERKAQRSFDESNVLRESLWLGGDFLIAFPPSLLQLYLAAASGAFGALLFVLVLIVYPRSSLKITSAGSYGARVLLGALIAVCVYIMLLGGSAVLGTSSSTMAGANYMTFCAVAVLAGMFSDRVADWLSQRANAFFKQQEGRENRPANEDADTRTP